jgi:hypothetical protein
LSGNELARGHLLRAPPNFLCVRGSWARGGFPNLNFLRLSDRQIRVTVPGIIRSHGHGPYIARARGSKSFRDLSAAENFNKVHGGRHVTVTVTVRLSSEGRVRVALSQAQKFKLSKLLSLRGRAAAAAAAAARA